MTVSNWSMYSNLISSYFNISNYLKVALIYHFYVKWISAYSYMHAPLQILKWCNHVSYSKVNFFIHEKNPTSIQWLDTICWIACLCKIYNVLRWLFRRSRFVNLLSFFVNAGTKNSHYFPLWTQFLVSIERGKYYYMFFYDSDIQMVYQ